MKEIIVRSQKEFDELPECFENETRIFIDATPDTWIEVSEKAPNSHVVARESSHVVARGSSHVEAWGSSRVVAWESSHVVARESSHVEAWGSSHVEAWGSSHVVAWESSHVEAWGSSHVEARESSHVEAWENSISRVCNKAVLLDLHQQAVAVTDIHNFSPNFQEDSASFLIKERFRHSLDSFTSCYPVENGGKLILYKSVDNTHHDFYSGQVHYTGTVECSDWDSNKERQCGGGLHLSPTPELALSYNEGNILVCEVDPEDIVVYPYDISKVRCRKVKVLGTLEDMNEEGNARTK